jgi:hypothetical protein
MIIIYINMWLHYHINIQNRLIAELFMIVFLCSEDRSFVL